MSCDERPQATRGQDLETQELAELLTNSKMSKIGSKHSGSGCFFLGTILEQSWETGKKAIVGRNVGVSL